MKNKYNVDICSVIFTILYIFISSFIHADKNITTEDRNITITEDGIITIVYTLLTLKMFLHAKKLLSQYNNIKMFVCTNILWIRRCEYHW